MEDASIPCVNQYMPELSVQQCIMHLRREGHKHIVNDSAVGCTPKNGNLNPYMTRTGLPVRGHAVTRGSCLLICSQTAES